MVAVAALGAVVWTYGGSYFAGSQPAAPEPAAAPAVAPGVTPSPAASTPAAPTQQEPKPPKEAKPSKEAKRKEAVLKEAAPDTPAAAKPKPDAAPADASPVVVATNVTSPDVLQPVVPDVTPKARATIHGKVPIVVRVQAGADGVVTGAAIESGGSVKYFADLALKAARQWKFVPGADGRVWMLRFEYTRDAQHPVPPQVTSIR